MADAAIHRQLLVTHDPVPLPACLTLALAVCDPWYKEPASVIFLSLYSSVCACPFPFHED
jgi:hypothetical protein